MRSHLLQGAAAGAIVIVLGMGTGTARAENAPAATPQAQSEQLDEVVVTARRKAENIQDVPIAVTALSAEALEHLSIKSAEDVQFHVPELQSNPDQYYQSAAPNYTLRAESTTSPGGTIGDTAVVTLFGDVPLINTRLIGHSIFDLGDIQVLKGPQGTLFGKNSTGGAVIFDPAKPTDRFEGMAGITLGDYGRNEYTAMINAPVDDSLDIRAAAKLGRRDGYIKNLSGPNLGDEDYQSGRLSVNYHPTETFETLTVANFEDSHENMAPKELSYATPPATSTYGLPLGYTFANPNLGAGATLAAQTSLQQALGPYKLYLIGDNFGHQENYFVENVSQVHFNEDLDLKNILGYQHSKALFSISQNSSLIDLIPVREPDNTSQFSEEMQLLGKAFDKKLDWIVGAFYSHAKDWNVDANNIFPNYNPFIPLKGALLDTITTNAHTDSTAVFGHGTVDLASLLPGLKFSAGYRYSWDKKYQDSNYVQSAEGSPLFCAIAPSATAVAPNCDIVTQHTFTAPSWTIGFDEQIDSSTLVYVASRRGYKAGGFNSTTGVPGTLQYGSEQVTDVEVGVKADWKLGAVPMRTNLALYDAMYEHVTLPVIAYYNNNLYQIIENAGAADAKGGEFELHAKPTHDIDFNLAYSLTTTAYGSSAAYVAAYRPNGAPIETSLSGEPIAQSSRHTMLVGATYDFDLDPSYGDLNLEMDYSWRSAQSLPAQGAASLHVPAFGVANLRLEWNQIANRPFDAAFWVKNLFDRTYLVAAQDLTSSIGIKEQTYGMPRMIGADLTYRF